MTLHRFVFGLAVLFVSMLLTASETNAKVQLSVGSGQYTGSGGVVFMNQAELLRMTKSLGLKVHIVKFVKLSTHDLEKLAKLSSKGCGCAAPQDGDLAGRGWECMKSCMAEFGVPTTMTAACTVACTGGVSACIACLGVAEYIVLGCAMYCAWAPLITENQQGAPLRHNLDHGPTGSSQQAKLSPRTGRVVTLR